MDDLLQTVVTYKQQQRSPRGARDVQRQTSSQETKPRFVLPAGWRIERHPRRGMIATSGRVDVYYFDPTGKRYRSLAEVRRALAGQDDGLKQTNRNESPNGGGASPCDRS